MTDQNATNLDISEINKKKCNQSRRAKGIRKKGKRKGKGKGKRKRKRRKEKEEEMLTLDHTPLTKLVTQWKKKKKKEAKEKQPKRCAVLLTTGSLNPIHKGHIEMMEKAKEELERNDKDVYVIGGYLSPSHDDYVSGKFSGHDFYNAKTRSHFVDLCVTNHDWLACDQWESQQSYFIDFPEVASRLHRQLNRIFETYRTAIEVYYVCGYDHASKCHLLSGRLKRINVNTLVVARPGYSSHQKHSIRPHPSVMVVDAPIDYDRSSTIVRQLLQTKDWKGLEPYLCPALLDYFKHHSHKQ
ncbi:hypothetical protein RFI_20080 [Reticulomyxa filosa]|uniref:Cytidyltransferase-like domain-containing protein n=1 Tax=Reticulomyxa filosa TaxID=46433 RepID=X6MTS8_RETFI|nr:hypothetical protein RFI_20080 [Reticulomyxa filosa]|eukprot:ETO17249.1 hypothetical protein RFI_20080 [Reticulomyxa filosa]